MWPDKSIDYIKLQNDEDGIHFAVWKNKEIVAVVSVFINKNKAQFRKLATLQNEQGNGYGSALINHIIAHLKHEKVNTLWCNARVDKTSFYKKFGLYETNEKFSRGQQEYIIMEMKL
ncbi:GNAT family N-acetyltransferase [Fulvivirga lutimaris]|nr:GNAT family N-acetyltransferase [Fulvivirga lutimaris]